MRGAHDLVVTPALAVEGLGATMAIGSSPPRSPAHDETARERVPAARSQMAEMVLRSGHDATINSTAFPGRRGGLRVNVLPRSVCASPVACKYTDLIRQT
jgi:hypothetical protein